MGSLRIVVLYDRVLLDETEEQAPAAEKAPVVRTLDKKEVEEEVAEALTKLGHQPVLYELDGTQKSLLGLSKVDCDLVFNMCESFGNDDTADFKIAAFLELLGKNYTGSGTHGLMLAQDKATAKKIFAFHGIHTPVFAKSFRGRLDFSHDLQFPVIVKPVHEGSSKGITQTSFCETRAEVKAAVRQIVGAHDDRAIAPLGDRSFLAADQNFVPVCLLSAEFLSEQHDFGPCRPMVRIDLHCGNQLQRDGVADSMLHRGATGAVRQRIGRSQTDGDVPRRGIGRNVHLDLVVLPSTSANHEVAHDDIVDAEHRIGIARSGRNAEVLARDLNRMAGLD